MTLTPRDFALAAIAAPEPESRFTSRMTFAPLVMACSACCCCVDLSPSAFWMVASTPASANAFFRNGRSTVSQRTDDFESGSSTATLPGLEPPPPDDAEPPLSLLLLSSPHAATNTMAPTTNAPKMSRRTLFFMDPPPFDTNTLTSLTPLPPGGWGTRCRPPTPPTRPHPGPRRDRRASRRSPWPPPQRPAAPRDPRFPAGRRARGHQRRRARRRPR